MSRVVGANGIRYDTACDVLIVGAGAAGLVAALKAKTVGADVLLVERDHLPRGSTALSAGLIPAAGTRFQCGVGIADSQRQFASDIMRKAHEEPDANAVTTVVRAIAPAIEWLTDAFDMPFSVITNFNYPGHSAHRMHGLPSRSGAELMDRLRAAAESASIEILADARATTLFVDAEADCRGIEVERPDGSRERIGCGALVLACNGYGGDRHLVSSAIPEMAEALYFGHSGNQGDAIKWGRELGAAIRHLSGYQGHGSVAHPHGILITWATVTEGGFQINLDGARFENEQRGYSEAAAAVLAQRERTAWTIFDDRIAGIARQFDDFRIAERQGAVLRAPTIEALANQIDVPATQLERTFDEIGRAAQHGETDAFGRRWTKLSPLQPDYCAVRVTAALFHTQGGLVVNDQARVRRADGSLFPNLFAAGGAACGVSGTRASGYLSGNGLLTAVAYGYLAGKHSAALKPHPDIG